jgi:hypothetical protein
MTEELAALTARFDALLVAVHERENEIKARRICTGRARQRDTFWVLGQSVQIGWLAGHIRSLGGREIKFTNVDGHLVVVQEEMP